MQRSRAKSNSFSHGVGSVERALSKKNISGEANKGNSFASPRGASAGGNLRNPRGGKRNTKAGGSYTQRGGKNRIRIKVLSRQKKDKHRVEFEDDHK